MTRSINLLTFAYVVSICIGCSTLKREKGFQVKDRYDLDFEVPGKNKTYVAQLVRGSRFIPSKSLPIHFSYLMTSDSFSVFPFFRDLSFELGKNGLFCWNGGIDNSGPLIRFRGPLVDTIHTGTSYYSMVTVRANKRRTRFTLALFKTKAYEPYLYVEFWRGVGFVKIFDSDKNIILRLKKVDGHRLRKNKPLIPMAVEEGSEWGIDNMIFDTILVD